jgi:hypothetical protein
MAGFQQALDFIGTVGLLPGYQKLTETPDWSDTFPQTDRYGDGCIK